MNADMCTVTINGAPRQVPKGAPLRALTDDPRALAAMADNELAELNRPVMDCCNVRFLTIQDPVGFRVFQRGAVFLMIYAAKQVLGRQTRIIVQHSIRKNYYCEFADKSIRATPALLADIQAVMQDACERAMPFEKLSLSMEEGVRRATECGLLDKAQTLKYRRTANVNFYKLDWFYDYFYGAMPPDAGCLSGFGLIPEDRGFMLLFPDPARPDRPSAYEKRAKITAVFHESAQWARILQIDTVGALNDRICGGSRGDVVRVCEALHEKRLAQIADRVLEKGARVVLVAGPSSSGKTTFAERLSIQMRVNGLNPLVLSMDNYYVNRADTPKDEYGELDFEALEAIDAETFNRDLVALLAGETVALPTFNFYLGVREYRGGQARLGANGLVVVEGIHGLNPALTPNIVDKDTFRIFISALTQLNIDDHNRIPTTDTRLIRRIVRDNQFRGFDARRTIEMWPSVTRGEDKHIFPFQEEADEIFNSALVYEMSVLKQYAEPVLFAIPKTAPEYAEAKRLVKFLDCFIGLPADEVPNNSILREFIGGGCFRT